LSADFYFPRLFNDMKVAVQKNNLRDKFCTELKTASIISSPEIVHRTKILFFHLKSPLFYTVLDNYEPFFTVSNHFDPFFEVQKLKSPKVLIWAITLGEIRLSSKQKPKNLIIDILPSVRDSVQKFWIFLAIKICKYLKYSINSWRHIYSLSNSC